MSTGQGGAAETVPTADAVGYIRDLLEQLGEGADAVLTEVLAGRDVRSLRVVGPLVMDGDAQAGRRHALAGVAGGIALAGQDPRSQAAPPGSWLWSVTSVGAAGTTPEPWPVDYAPTRLAADRALCLALRELGWNPVEVPTEEEAAVPPGPTPEQLQAHREAEVRLRTMVFGPPQGVGSLTVSSGESDQMTMAYDTLRVAIELTRDPWIRIDAAAEFSDLILQVWPDPLGSVEVSGPWGVLRARDIRMDTEPNERARMEMRMNGAQQLTPRRQRRLAVEDLRNRVGSLGNVGLEVLDDAQGRMWIIEGHAGGGSFRLGVPDGVLQREGTRDIEVTCANMAYMLRQGMRGDWPAWVSECELLYSLPVVP